MSLINSKCFSNDGYLRGYLIDLVQNKGYFIPNSLNKLINTDRDTNKWLSNNKKNKEIEEYIEFLDSVSILHDFTSDEKKFIDLQQNFYCPQHIKSVIIKIDNDITFFNELVLFLNVNNICCLSFHINKLNKNILNSLKIISTDTYVESIDLILLENNFLESFESIIENCPLIAKITVLNASKEESYFLDSGNQISIIKRKLFQKYHENKEFIINQKFYLESQKYNPYFNKKIFIDNQGFISNSHLDSEKFYLSKYCDKPIIEYIQYSIISKYWNINKNIINICKDCEFRFICHDSKIPLKNLKGQYYYNIECNYNPYIAKWVEEEGYQTLEQCGVISNEHGFSIDHEKIAKINAILWDEK